MAARRVSSTPVRRLFSFFRGAGVAVVGLLEWEDMGEGGGLVSLMVSGYFVCVVVIVVMGLDTRGRAGEREAGRLGEDVFFMLATVK